MDNQPQTEYRPMLYDRKHLIVKTAGGGKPVVVAECINSCINIPKSFRAISCQLWGDESARESIGVSPDYYNLLTFTNF